MANIAINNYCNLKCPYCFANEMIEEDQKSITEEQLIEILNFLSRSKINRIGIIGGEPTIHPHFKEILNTIQEFTKNKHIKCVVFSNGICLGDYAREFKLYPNTGCLINCNPPDIIGQKKWEDIRFSLKRFQALEISQCANLGINLHPELKDFNYILELCQEFKKEHVRCSYVAPTCNYKGVSKWEYYQNSKEMILDFASAAKAKGLEVRIDCNFAPKCIFTDKELAIMSNVTGWKTYCNPVIDIMPDMTCTPCFGTYHKVDIAQFDNLEEIERFFLLTDIRERTLKNNEGKCQNCEKFKNFSCQGGCLAFSSLN